MEDAVEAVVEGADDGEALVTAAIVAVAVVGVAVEVAMAGGGKCWNSIVGRDRTGLSKKDTYFGIRRTPNNSRADLDEYVSLDETEENKTRCDGMEMVASCVLSCTLHYPKGTRRRST